MDPEQDALVSVIIPLYNGGRFIVDTINSLLQQDHTHLEVLVIDDGSNDESPLLVRRIGEGDARIILVKKPHVGIAGTRNAGLSWVSETSRYVLFLDQDDILQPTVLSRLVSILNRRYDAVGAYVIADYIDEHGKPFLPGQFAGHMLNRQGYRGGKMVGVSETEDVRWYDLFISNHLYPPSAVLLRSDVVLSVGGFDTTYTVADDWDLMVRVARRGAIVPCNQILVGYRRHEVNASSNTDLNIRETRSLWANVYYSAENQPGERRLLRRIWRAHQRMTAKRKATAGLGAISRKRPCAGLNSLLDAGGHAIIPRPLQAWRTSVDASRPLVTGRVGTIDAGQNPS